MLGGEFQESVVKSRHPSLSRAREPFCTKSQIIAYINGAGDNVVLLHRYLRTDGSLGASGLPDPKRLLHNGTLYFVAEPS